MDFSGQKNTKIEFFYLFFTFIYGNANNIIQYTYKWTILPNMKIPVWCPIKLGENGVKVAYKVDFPQIDVRLDIKIILLMKELMPNS